MYPKNDWRFRFFGGGIWINNLTPPVLVYNSAGQLVKSSTSGQAPTLYEYNELGEQVRSAVDINGNDQIDEGGTDRITEMVRAYEKVGSDWWQVSGSIIYPKNGSAATLTNGVQRTRLKVLLFEVLEDKPPVDDPRETMIKSRPFRRNPWQAHVTPPC